MNLDDYRTIFVTCSLVLMLIAASPALGLIIQLPSSAERFSELWILGPNHTAENYPFNVSVNQVNSVFVGVGNHLGGLSYYSILVKIRNQTQPLPNATSSEPSVLPPLYEFRAFVRDNETWETRVTFSISDASLHNDSVSLNRVIINGKTFALNSTAKFDTEHNGFYYELFFELWLYRQDLSTLEFNDRFVGIWLNVTA